VEVGAVPEGLSPEDVRERTPHAFERYAEENLRTREELASLLGGEQATALLFPANRVTIPVPRPARLVVPDGSWRQARRIIARFPEVQQLPRFSLPPPEATQRRMRRPPLAEGMSTIEAVARALAVLEGEHVAVELEKLYTLHVERQLGTRRRNQRG
jgi:DTW domain-containing protein YfiP